MIVTGGADGEVRVWDESGVVVGVLAVGNGVTGMVCVPGRPDAVIVASGSDHVDIVDVRTAKVLQTLTVTVQPNTPVPQLNHVAASKSGKFVYAMGSDGVLYVFRAETGRIAHALRPHGQEVFGITHHPTSNMLATYSRDGTLRLWSS
jgi:WD40 repeat-containing protein SMU1